MYLIPFLHFSAFMIYVALGICVYTRDPRSRVNRAGVALLGAFALWSVCAGFAQSPFISQAAARLLYDIAAIGWIGFAPAFLWLALAFDGTLTARKLSWARIILAGIALILFYEQLCGRILAGYALSWYGWSYVWSGSVWAYLFYAFYLASMALTYWLIWRRSLAERSALRKQQAAVILTTIPAAVIIGTACNVSVQLAGWHVIPPLADVVSGLIWSVGIVCAMVRYRFFGLVPAAATQKIFEAMTDILFIVDTDGTILVASRQARLLFDPDGSDVAGLNIKTLHSDAAAILRGMLERLTGPAEYQETVFTMDGRRIPLVIAATVLKDAIGAPIGVVFAGKDMTEREAAAAAVRRNEAYFHALIERGNDLVIVYDGDMRIRYISPSVEQVTGRRADALIGKLLTAFMHPDDASMAVELFQKALASPGVPLAATIRVRARDGKWRVVEAVGRSLMNDPAVQGVVVNARDITDTERVKTRLAESELRYEIIARQTGLLMYDRDVLTGKTRWSGAIEEVTGFGEDDFQEVDAEEWTELIHPDDREAVIRQLGHALRAGGRYDIEYRIMRKETGPAFVEEHGVFIADDRGAPQRALGSIRDISKRRKMEEELGRKYSSVEKFNRLAVDREVRMMELKTRIRELEEELGRHGS